MPFELDGRPYDRFLCAAYGRTLMYVDGKSHQQVEVTDGPLSIEDLRKRGLKMKNAPRPKTDHMTIEEMEKFYRDQYGTTKVPADPVKWPSKEPVIAAIRDLQRASHLGLSCILRYALYTGPVVNQDQEDIVKLCRFALDENKHFFIKPDPRACGNCNNRVENVGYFMTKGKGNGYQLCQDCKGNSAHILKRRQAAEAELAAQQEKK